MEPEIHCIDELWVLKPDTQKNLISWLSRVDLSKPLTVRITDKKPTRTELQNRYLFGWVYAQLGKALADAGIGITTAEGMHPWTKDLLHETMRTKFLVKGEVVSKKSGRSILIYHSSTNLSTTQFGEFCKNVRDFAWEFWGVQIPEPPEKSIFNAWRQ